MRYSLPLRPALARRPLGLVLALVLTLAGPLSPRAQVFNPASLPPDAPLSALPEEARPLAAWLNARCGFYGYLNEEQPDPFFVQGEEETDQFGVNDPTQGPFVQLERTGATHWRLINLTPASSEPTDNALHIVYDFGPRGDEAAPAWRAYYQRYDTTTNAPTEDAQHFAFDAFSPYNDNDGPTAPGKLSVVQGGYLWFVTLEWSGELLFLTHSRDTGDGLDENIITYKPVSEDTVWDAMASGWD